MSYKVQAPNEALIWALDWDDNDWLGVETISSSSWTIGPTGPTLSSDSNTTTTTQVKVSGLVYGVQYVLTNTIGTSGGQTGVRSIVIKCTDTP